MHEPTNIANVCCVAIELSKSSWVNAFSPPADAGKSTVHQIAAKDISRLLSFLESSRLRAEREAGRPLDIVVCYEVGYDGFWLARLLIARGIRTIVFDPASFLMPRKGRRAKTDRLDAEGMTRTLRSWLSGDREVARDVQIPTVEEEDAKRIERERKHLVEQRTSIVGRIKGLLALHGIHLTGKRIGKGLQERLDHIKTGDGRNLAPFLRRDIERMLQHYEFICNQIKAVEADRQAALADNSGKFPHREKVHRLTEGERPVVDRDKKLNGCDARGGCYAFYHARRTLPDAQSSRGLKTSYITHRRRAALLLTGRSVIGII